MPYSKLGPFVNVTPGAVAPVGAVKLDAAAINHLEDGIAAAQALAEAGTGSGGAAPTYANLPGGTTITVLKAGGAWPARPTNRTDIVVQWKGADPSPSIITTGTGGMLDNVDVRLVTP